jgi:hypothetical protein
MRESIWQPVDYGQSERGDKQSKETEEQKTNVLFAKTRALL